MPGRVEIDDVAPVVSCGAYPAKAVIDEVIPVRAAVWREGHDAVAATLVLLSITALLAPALTIWRDLAGVVQDAGVLAAATAVIFVLVMLRLTALAHSGLVELSSPVTAALPHRICTCFPILPGP